MRAPRPTRRASPRARLNCPLTLRRSAGSPVDGRTMDIGGGGMLVTTSRPLAVDETLHFTVTTDAGVHLDGDARVMRCERPDVYALKVEHPDEVLLDQLERLVRQAQGDAVGRPA